MAQFDDTRVNRDITAPSIRLVDQEGTMLGIVALEQGLETARKAGLDLVEVSPNAEPPVCKILDYGKFKYQAQKKAHDARKKQKSIQVKEIKMRPNIGEHDYLIKRKNIEKFLEGGDKVKVTIRFRGREAAHSEIGFELLRRIQEETEELAKTELEPRKEGRQMLMVLAPK